MAVAIATGGRGGRRPCAAVRRASRTSCSRTRRVLSQRPVGEEPRGRPLGCTSTIAVLPEQQRDAARRWRAFMNRLGTALDAGGAAAQAGLRRRTVTRASRLAVAAPDRRCVTPDYGRCCLPAASRSSTRSHHRRSRMETPAGFRTFLLVSTDSAVHSLHRVRPDGLSVAQRATAAPNAWAAAAHDRSDGPRGPNTTLPVRDRRSAADDVGPATTGNFAS